MRLLRRLAPAGLLLLLLACNPETRLPPAVPTPMLLVQPAVEATLTPFQPLPTTAVPPTPTATLTPSPTPDPLITLLFTGVIVPARCVQAGIDNHGGEANYIFAEVRDVIRSADLAVGTFNATMSDVPHHTGCVVTFVLVGGAHNADALQWAGFKVMSVATNHIKNCGASDCGDRAFLDTLDNLDRVGILPVGAGNNLAEALQPVVVNIKGVRFGFVSLGMVEPMTFAGKDSPGIAPLTDENLKTAIEAARKVSDVVIAMPHMGPEDSPAPQAYQQSFARAAVEDGADLVVGNHTHVVQGIQTIQKVPVFYGLGNFVFDQTWALDHQQGVILLVTFKGKQYQGYQFIPTHVDMDGTLHLAGKSEADEILKRIADNSLK